MAENNKLDILKGAGKEKTDKLAAAAALKENNEIDKKEKTSILVSAFPVYLKDAIKEEVELTGKTVNAYIREAVYRVAKEDGVI